MAHSLGMADSQALTQQLQHWRELVSQEFERLLRPSHDSAAQTAPAPPAQHLDSLLESLNPALRRRVAGWSDMPRVRALREDARQRLLRLLQRIQTWLDEGRISEASALRWCDWMEPLLRRETYLALLLERPQVHAQLLKLLDAGRWTTTYLMKHPGVIDELADPAMLSERLDSGQIQRNLQMRHDALQAHAGDDEESLLNVLRRAHHNELFLTLARDVQGRLTVEQVADDLSALADTMVHITAQWVWQRLK